MVRYARRSGNSCCTPIARQALHSFVGFLDTQHNAVRRQDKRGGNTSHFPSLSDRIVASVLLRR